MQINFRHQHSDGSWRALNATLRNALNDDHVNAVVFNARDVTEQELLWSQLLQAQKMEMVGQLAGGIAHDFNNLLSVILNYARFALDKLPENSPAALDLYEIEKAGQRTVTLTRQLLTYSRKQVYLPQRLNLADMLGNVERLICPLIGEHISLCLDTAGELGIVEIDPGQFEQLVLNLVVNARDAMSQGGELQISCRNLHNEAAIADATNSSIAPGDYVALRVRDHGKGITSDVIEHIFEPFFTTKPAGKGTGLGLSTIYGIVKQSNGAIFVDSVIGQGTSFDIWFPRIEASPAEVVRPARPTPFNQRTAPLGGNEEIVLLEDDDAVLEVVRRMLDKLGYRVFATSDVAEAVERCTNPESTIALLITDIVMPAANGLEVAARVRAARPALPCMYMSGYSEDFIEDTNAIEQTRLLQKPFTPASLAQKIREVLDAAEHC